MAWNDSPLQLAEGAKFCACCQSTKSAGDFYRDKAQPDGLYRKCKKCHCEATARYAKNNAEKVAAAGRAKRAADPEKMRAKGRADKARAYQADPEKFKARAARNRAADREKTNASSYAAKAKNPGLTAAYLAAYYVRNKGKIKAMVRAREKALGASLRPINAAKSRARSAAKMNATPAWADRPAMLAIYKSAARASADTGRPHHVDHIVPLKSKLVCGLHVQHNLQVLDGVENQEKSNKWWPGMP